MRPSRSGRCSASALFLLAASAGGVERKHLLFVAVAPAVAVNLFFGQNGFFFAALLIGGLINLDRRPLLAGMLFGILTIKPQLGLLLPVMLVLTGRWRVIAAAAATTLVLFGATCWLYGIDVWREYLDKVVPMQRYLQENGAGPAAAADPLGVLRRAAGRASDPDRLDRPGAWCRRRRSPPWSGPTGGRATRCSRPRCW